MIMRSSKAFSVNSRPNWGTNNRMRHVPKRAVPSLNTSRYFIIGSDDTLHWAISVQPSMRRITKRSRSRYKRLNRVSTKSGEGHSARANRWAGSGSGGNATARMPSPGRIWWWLWRRCGRWRLGPGWRTPAARGSAGAPAAAAHESPRTHAAERDRSADHQFAAARPAAVALVVGTRANLGATLVASRALAPNA